MNKIRVAGAIASKSGATLYLENGQEVNLLATKWETTAILDDVAASLKRGQVIEIDLDAYSLERRIEKKSGGFLAFVREKVANFFGHRMTADPASETLVAVVNGKKIPGIEALGRQMEHAVKTDNTVGLSRFMARIATVIDTRGHTVQELLRFMERGDLPIADDGSIVAYKRLYRQSGERYVDPHTRKVSQTVGSHVSMPVDLIDESRRTQCSTGLHIGRRDYMRSFHGDVICIVKIAPEDVVAVPHNEPDKMRVAAYHIVAELPQAAFDLVVNNRPMTSLPEAADLLGAVVAGRHIGITEYVRVNGEAGQDVTITAVDGAVIRTSGRVAPIRALDDEKLSTIDIARVRNKINEAVATGDLSAAVSAPEPEKSVVPEQPVPEKVAEPKLTNGQYSPIDLAIMAVKDGMSQREAVKKFKVCAKTIRRRLKDQ